MNVQNVSIVRIYIHGHNRIQTELNNQRDGYM